MSEEVDYDEAALKKRMDKTLESLSSEFGGLRTGRASASLLDNVTVMAYGAQTPLNQVGSVSVPDPRHGGAHWSRGRHRLVLRCHFYGLLGSPADVLRVVLLLLRHRAFPRG